MLDKFTHLAMPYSFIFGMAAGVVITVLAYWIVDKVIAWVEQDDIHLDEFEYKTRG